MKSLLRVFFCISFAVLLCVLLPQAEAKAAESGSCGLNVNWTLDDAGTLTISGTGEMKPYESHNEIPWYKLRSGVKALVVEDGVTSICDNAFYDCGSLKSATIGAGLRSIGDKAFGKCYDMKEIHIKDLAAWCGISGLTNLVSAYDGKDMYLNGTLLTELVIPDGVTAIADESFSGFECFTSVTIPAGVTSIGANAFGDCYQNTAFLVAEGNSAYAAHDGVLFSKDGTELVAYPTGREGAYTIPEGVTRIDEHAFEYSRRLTDVTIPDSVTEIGAYAFRSCNGLTEVELPDGLTNIPSFLFYYCRNLKSVTIPASVVRIQNGAFSECPSLAEIHYGGDETQWAQVNVHVGVQKVIDKAVMYYGSGSATEPEGEKAFFHMSAKEVVDGKYHLTTLFSCPADLAARAFGARYDADGRFLGLEELALGTEKENTLSVAFEDGSEVRIFAVGAATFAPLCAPAQASLE